MDLLNLRTLEDRRKISDLTFTYKLLPGDILSLSYWKFKFPVRATRNSDLFQIPFHSTNYGLNNLPSRCVRLASEYGARGLEFIGTTLNKFNSFEEGLGSIQSII
ncbi:hypothetical protein HHI36_016395 [Cryptolaemus montrouzieri]|uniref:Uncharacterized protein n=1 Tax=Cryptolaemus montrouzieri TaxID=559131 RepID=A0ABD2NK06_9CUCU